MNKYNKLTNFGGGVKIVYLKLQFKVVTLSVLYLLQE